MGRTISSLYLAHFQIFPFYIVQDKKNNNTQIRGMSVSWHASLQNAFSQSQTNLTTTKPKNSHRPYHTNQDLNYSVFTEKNF